MTVKKAVVIGAGVMGAGIAAQLANAGIEVELLDIVPRDLAEGADRDVIAKAAIEKMLKAKPAPFMHKRNAKLIRAGNTEDHLDRLKDADLIIEAVIENPKIKSALFKKIDANRKAGSIVGSNTSTIPLKTLAEGQSDAIKKDLVITHFFNPPRYMPLLELVTSTDNDPKTVEKLEKFMDEKLGKTVVRCKDTPGFIANRIGTYWLTVAMGQAVKMGMTVEEADAVGGAPMGIPKSGIFGLVDMVGLDLMPYIGKSLLANVPVNDDYRKAYTEMPLVDKMIAEGYTGRKGKGGFYRMNKEGGKKQLEAIDLYSENLSYAPAKKPAVQSAKRAKKDGLRGIIKGSDWESEYAWEVLKKTLSYAAAMIPEIHDDIHAIDEAMKLGYNWKRGPFEMIDKIGVDYFIKRLKAEGAPVPEMLQKAKGKSFYKTMNGKLHRLDIQGQYKAIARPEGVLLLSDVKRGAKPVAGNSSAKLWDIGDGVLCLEFTSLKNMLDPLTMRMINKACDMVENPKNGFKALVIHNEDQLFSAGANIWLAEKVASAGQYWLVEKMVRSGQNAYKRLKFSNFPVVAAPAGVALGGGCEILLHADAVQAHAETYMGLVEMGVGLIPGWGGCAEMMRRSVENKKRPGGLMPPVAQMFETIAMGKISASAEEARSMLFMASEHDGVTMNKSRLLYDAKMKALKMAKDGYTPPQPAGFKLPGASGRAALQLAVNDMYQRGLISSYGVVLADQLAGVLSGGDKADAVTKITEDDIRALELQAFMRLARDPRTRQRLQHMIKFNKPLDMNPAFLKEDAVMQATPEQLRQSLKNSKSLTGIVNKPTGLAKKLLKPSFDAAAKVIARPLPKKQPVGKRRPNPKKD